VEERLGSVLAKAAELLALSLHPLIAANACHGAATGEQIQEIDQGVLGRGVRRVAWNPEVRAQIATVARRLGVDPLRSAAGGLTGCGVRVAVLDSGIDPRHPFLKVASAVSTCPEPAGVPGRHGTFCAGVIASRHPHYAGIAPEVELLDVKIARSDGVTTPAALAQGIDEAMDRHADVLSISFGLNQEGHGWTCPNGDCILCRAADHAARCGAVVVTAAGNQHRSKVSSRGTPRTELLCPGQARRAITVGATEKAPTAELYPLSSHGPTAYGLPKPDLVAPGVDVISTILGDGTNEDHLFSLGSGTSVSAAVVAGAVALLIEARKRRGEAWTPEEIRSELLGRCVRRLEGELPNAAGAGCLDLSGMCR